jgi:hypothetical protein
VWVNKAALILNKRKKIIKLFIAEIFVVGMFCHISFFKKEVEVKKRAQSKGA